MFYTVTKISGIIAIIIAWFFVVTPALKFGINSKSDTITTSTNKNSVHKKIISFGLVVGAVFQTMFAVYLIRRFSIPLLSPGIIMYLSANVATICVAIFTEKKYPKTHKIMARYYFIVCPLSFLFIGLSLKSTDIYPKMISIITPIVYFVKQSVLWKKYKTDNALMEFWAFIILSLWTIVMTFI